jgi:hypothetical protein
MAWLEKILYVEQTAPYRQHAMYAGVVNTTNTPAFIVLMATSTASDINTALNNYDVVYLEPGTYSMGSTQVSVPSGKKLIGLGDWHTTNRVILQWAGSPANHLYMNNGWIENLNVNLNGAAHTGGIIVGDSTDANNYLFKIVVDADNAYDYPAFTGPANEIRGMYVQKLNGIYVTNRGYAHFGTIEGVYVYNAPTYGVQLGANASRFIIRNVVVVGNSKTTNYGIFWSIDAYIERITIEDCFAYDCDNGFYLVQTGTNYSYIINMSRCTADNCHTGYNITRPSLCNFTDLEAWNSGEDGGGSAFYFNHGITCTIKGCIAHGTPNGGYNLNFMYLENSTVDGCRANGGYKGFEIANLTNCVMSNCVAQECDTDGVGAGTYGRNFAFYNVERSSISNLTSLQCNSSNGAGFMLSGTVGESTFDGLTDYQSTYGVYLTGGSINSVSIYNVNVYNPGYTGFIADNNTRYRLIVKGVNVFSAANYGIAIYGCDQSQFSNLYAGESANFGINIIDCDYSTFSNLNADNGSSAGIYFTTSTHCAISNIVARYNRGGGGFYIVSGTYSSVSGIVTSDNSAYGVYISSIGESTISNINANYDDTYGVYVHSSGSSVISNAAIYATGSYGFCIDATLGITTSIIKNIFTDSCITYGQYYGTPLRSQFQGNKAINESTAGYYGFYFNNNGTGYNQFSDCNYNNCNTGINNTGHARWYYDHWYNQD